MSERQRFEDLIGASPLITDVLEVVAATDERLYVSAGVLRNYVWDHLHGYETPTPLNDIDIVYFDAVRADKSDDVHLEARLMAQRPALPWAVANQARMHLGTETTPSLSVAEALSKGPETCTATAVRLTGAGVMELIAPHGLSDMFEMVVRPSPTFANRLDEYQARQAAKNWIEIWPKLTILDS